jgi:hypothetical protein
VQVRKALDLDGNGVGDLAADLWRDGSRNDEVVAVERVNILELEKLRTGLPVAVGEKGTEIVDRGFVEEEEVGMSCDAGGDAFGWSLAGLLSPIDEAGEVADVSAGEVADETDVDGDSGSALEALEVIGLELLEQGGSGFEHGVEGDGLEWKREEEERKKNIGRC